MIRSCLLNTRKPQIASISYNFSVMLLVQPVCVKKDKIDQTVAVSISSGFPAESFSYLGKRFRSFS
ncbi:MAG: hypothetical protein CSA26_06780 [Desulfobacterales bacterium]|nr:MAG: hypothetical protein CSA26_06780 [Desulfobacterales bacterium]